MWTSYGKEVLKELSIRFFKEVQRRLQGGEALASVLSEMKRISYEVHKRWHVERYVVHR